MNFKQLIHPWVVAQILLFAAILILDEGNDFTLSDFWHNAFRVISALGWIVLLVAVVNLRRSLAIEPIPKKGAQLQSLGIYKYVRHPMYIAVWMILTPSTLGSQTWIGLALFAVMIAFFVAKSRYEERRLQEVFPDYSQYMKKVGAFIPKP